VSQFSRCIWSYAASVLATKPMLGSRNRERLRRFALLLGATFISSCAAMKTDVAPIEGVQISASGASGARTTAHDGVPYYLPRSLLNVKVTAGASGPSIDATGVDVADVAQHYVAYYEPSVFSDDQLCVSRTDDGLLQKIYFSGNDRTADVLLNVVQLVGSAGLEPIPPGGALPAVAKLNATSMTIDPTNQDQIAAFNRSMGPGYKLKIGYLPVREHPFVCPQDSICFATRATVPISITYNNRLVAQNAVKVVDPTSYGSIDVSRAFMTARVTKLDFASGVLTAMRVRKDSEALAVSQFPLNAIERLVAVPGNGIAASVGTFAEKSTYLQQKQQLTNAAGTATAPPAVTGLVDIDTCMNPAGTTTPPS
jgi:hypothetical protein